MRNQRISTIVILLISAILLAACSKGSLGGGTAGETPTPLPPATTENAIVVDGRVVPRQSVELTFNTEGVVAEILVDEGAEVQAGGVIARLGNREPLEANLEKARLELLAAQLELFNAQQARQALFDDLPEAQTNALQALKDARQAVKDAERKVAGLSTQVSQADLDEAKATMILAKDKLDRAKKDYKPFENASENNVVRAALLNRLAQAQRDYDNAVRRYNNLVGGSTEFSRMQAQAELEIAKARLDQAQKDYDLLSKGPRPADLEAADKRIAAAEGRVAAAEAGIKSAEAALADLDLVAPITGTLVKLDLTVGQRVSRGAPVATIADLNWYVETDNLTEIEVVNVSVGQRVTVTPDALPEVEMSGVVEKISNIFEEKRGDVTYTVRIKLDDPDPRLRWGMTTVVTIEQ